MKIAEPNPNDWAKMNYDNKAEIAHWYATQFLRLEDYQDIAEVEWLIQNLTPTAWTTIQDMYFDRMKELEDDGFFQ